MIREEMQLKGIQSEGQEVFEIEIVEYDPDGDSFACLDTFEVTHLALDEAEARQLFKEARTRVKQLNDERGGRQDDGTFLGLRLNTYRIDERDGMYYPMETEEYYGEYSHSYPFCLN